MHAKVKLRGYDCSYNQCIKLSELKKTAPGIVKTFSRGKEQEIINLRPRKIILEIDLVLILVESYVYIFFKAKSIIIRVKKLVKII